MAYEPTVWQTGDVVTAEKMNKLESGIVAAANSGGGVYMVEDTDGTLDISYNQAVELLSTGQMIGLFSVEQVVPGFTVTVLYLCSVAGMEDSGNGVTYMLQFNGSFGMKMYIASDPDAMLQYTEDY